MKNTGENYDWQALVIVSVLMIISLGMILLTWGGMEITSENIYDYIYKQGIVVIFAIFFFGVGLYCWYLWITNVWAKPKQESMCLKDSFNQINTVLVFVGADNRSLMYTIKDVIGEANHIHFEIGKSYNVLRTKRRIHQVIGLVNSDTIPKIEKIKESFWLIWYSPMGKYENIFLLPIVYLLFLPGFISFLIADGFDKIWGIMFAFVPAWLIIYDIALKIKNK